MLPNHVLRLFLLACSCSYRIIASAICAVFTFQHEKFDIWTHLPLLQKHLCILSIRVVTCGGPC